MAQTVSQSAVYANGLRTEKPYHLKKDKTKFKAALRKHQHTHFFYSVDEFCMRKDSL